MNHGGNVWQGGDPAAWLDYSANIRPGGPPAWVRKALSDAMDKVSYYPQLGMDNAKAALAAYLAEHPVRDAVVLVKGSRGIQMEKVLPQL